MKTSVRFLLITVLIMNTGLALAQNLIPNGNFEYKKGRRNSHRPWRFVNTVDFYVMSGSVKRPKGSEEWHLPKPKDGIAFIGLRIYPTYREFVQIKLSNKLVEGQRYYFEMWVSWSDHSNYYAKQLGASIYHKKPYYTSEYFIYTNPAQIELKSEKGILQSEESPWIKITGTYRAKGGEKYLTLGNFSTTHFKSRLKKTKWWSLNFWHHEAYYFIDAVSLIKLEDYSVENDSILVENIPDSNIVDHNENYIYAIEKDSTIVIENIQFASASDRLLPKSFRDLELILEYLNENPDKKIQIIGHSDNVGSLSANLKLSQKRAKSVFDYFITNYIDKSKISYLGMGESQPIQSNETTMGRKANRRVELKLLQD